MFGKATYLIWIALFMGLPIAWMVWRGRDALWKRRAALGWTVLGSLVGGWAWDAYAVQVGVWFYDKANYTNWWIFGLPLEEWLWIMGVTLLFGSLTVLLKERENPHA